MSKSSKHRDFRYRHLYARLIAAVGLSAGLAPATPTAAQEDEAAEIGVVALVNPAAELSREETVRPPMVGEDVLLQDTLSTGGQGQVHLMLADKSTFTIGPNSEVVLDRFVYDPSTQSGEMALSAARGVMRFVGGELSKNDPIEISTGIGTIGIRGGILLLQFQQNGGFVAIFGFGSEMTFVDLTGGPVSVVRPGFMISVSPDGVVTGPEPVSDEMLDQILSLLEGSGETTDEGGPFRDSSQESAINELPIQIDIEDFDQTDVSTLSEEQLAPLRLIIESLEERDGILTPVPQEDDTDDDDDTTAPPIVPGS